MKRKLSNSSPSRRSLEKSPSSPAALSPLEALPPQMLDKDSPPAPLSLTSSSKRQRLDEGPSSTLSLESLPKEIPRQPSPSAGLSKQQRVDTGPSSPAALSLETLPTDVTRQSSPLANSLSKQQRVDMGPSSPATLSLETIPIEIPRQSSPSANSLSKQQHVDMGPSSPPAPSLETLPSEILREIQIHVSGEAKVDLEVTEDGTVLVKDAVLLNISRGIRKAVLHACASKQLDAVYIVRSPAAMTAFCALPDDFLPPRRTLRLLLNAPFDLLDLEESFGDPLSRYDFKPEPKDPRIKHALHFPDWDELTSNTQLAIQQTFEDWRHAFKTHPKELRMVHFDFTRNFGKRIMELWRLAGLFSMILHRRTGGLARCKVLGCRTRLELADAESVLVNVVRSHMREEDEEEEVSMYARDPRLHAPDPRLR